MDDLLGSVRISVLDPLKISTLANSNLLNNSPPEASTKKAPSNQLNPA